MNNLDRYEFGNFTLKPERQPTVWSEALATGRNSFGRAGSTGTQTGAGSFKSPAFSRISSCDLGRAGETAGGNWSGNRRSHN